MGKLLWPFTLNASVPRVSNLALWTPGGEGGLQLRDMSPNRTNGDMLNFGNSGSSGWVAGNGGGRGALAFDGVDDTVVFGQFFSFERTNAFSISCWVNPNVPRTGTNSSFSIFSKILGSGQFTGWEICLNYDNPSNASKTGMTFSLIQNLTSYLQCTTSNCDIPNGQWSHICVTYNGNSASNGVSFFVNGNPVPTISLNSNLTGSIQTTAITSSGSRNGGFSAFFGGTIEDLTVHTRVLTPLEVAEIYQDPWDLRYRKSSIPTFFGYQEVPAVFPTAAQVLNGVQYGPVTGTEFTGTVVLPTIDQVINTVNYGPSSSLTGVVRQAPQATVLDTQNYGANDSLTGTVVLPTTDQVLIGVNFGPSSGLAGDVTLPDVSDVVNPAAYGPNSGSVGTYISPDPSGVAFDVNYGPSSSITGTLTDPGVDNVLNGVDYWSNGNAKTGDYFSVAVGNVRLGVTFGPNNSDVGTLNVNGTTTGGGIGDYMQGKVLQQAAIADLSSAVALSSVLSANTSADSVYIQAFTQNVYVTVDGSTPAAGDITVIAGGPPVLVQGLTPMTATALALLKAKEATSAATACVFLVQSPRSAREP